MAQGYSSYDELMICMDPGYGSRPYMLSLGHISYSQRMEGQFITRVTGVSWQDLCCTFSSFWGWNRIHILSTQLTSWGCATCHKWACITTRCPLAPAVPGCHLVHGGPARFLSSFQTPLGSGGTKSPFSGLGKKQQKIKFRSIQNGYRYRYVHSTYVQIYLYSTYIYIYT